MIVQIKAASFCHTQLMVLASSFGGPPGFVLDHEPCGIVVAVGFSVTKFKPGDRVGCGLSQDTCGSCCECRRGTDSYCSSAKLGGLTVDGGMAELLSR
jgi:D-arabinose 1-dehydrogenase-like Zn-dependent alcohol dehydrogenase